MRARVYKYVLACYDCEFVRLLLGVHNYTIMCIWVCIIILFEYVCWKCCNPRPASSKQRQGVDGDAITGTGSFGAFKSAGRGLEGAKKRKRRSCTGIFVTRLARNTQPRDVIRHIEQETGIRCQCEPIQTKYNSYTSFCIRLNPSLHRRLLNPTVWPTGTLVREFLEST